MNASTENLSDWATTLSNWRQSGLSQVAFCRRENIKPHLFSYYKLKLEGKDPKKQPKQATANGFAQVATHQPPGHSNLQLTLANGMTFSGIQSDNLSTVNELLRMIQ